MLSRMNRSAREPLVGGRNTPVSQHRRVLSLTGISKDFDEKLDLFSRNRLTLSVASPDDSSDGNVKLGRLSLGSVKAAKYGIDDLLSSTDGGKHDYDWLLTPPETPLLSSSNGTESQATLAARRSTFLVRSSSTTKASRLSVSQSDSTYSSRPTRSSSVTRSPISTPQYSANSSNRSLALLNTSSASVSSYTRPSSPVSRSPSTARPLTPSSRPISSRSSTPSRVRPNSTSSIDKSQPLHSSRPSTPSSRPQIPPNLGSPAARSNSRPTTPTRRNAVPSLSTVVVPTTSGARPSQNGRNTTPASRPSSPGPRVRPSPQPIIPPDFPHDTPPNLRTTLPDRPISAGRSRPGVTASVKGNTESPASVNVSRRSSSPTVTRGRLIDSPGKGFGNSKVQLLDSSESRKATHAPEAATRKPVRTSTATPESTGFGRTISKKSLDMAIRHMDIRNGTGSIRPLSGTTLFPQSIKPSTSKNQPIPALNSVSSVNVNGDLHWDNNGAILENGNHFHRTKENGAKADDGRFSAKLSEVDNIYESSRYDAILLKEDVRNTNWLLGVGDKTDIEPIFDNGFDPLPEPFGLL